MRQMMKAPLPLCAAAFLPLMMLLSGCANSETPRSTPPTAQPAAQHGPAPTPILPHAQDIAVGQRAYADGPTIEVVKILEDSRCPQNARCVWAGRLKLAMVWYRGNGEAQPFELTLGEITHIADGHIEITAATPPRLAGEGSTAVTDYRFSFRFSGGL